MCFKRLVGWLAGWLVRVGRLVCLFVWLVYFVCMAWLLGCLFRVFVRLIGYFVEWLVGLVGCMFD